MKIQLLASLLSISFLLSCGNSDTQGSTAPEQEVVEETDQDIEENSTSTLVWSDEFDGDFLNTEDWRFETGSNGWGNNELQNYTAGDNLEVSDGTLKIIARRVGIGQNVGDYTSTRLLSTRTFQYGRLEIRAKIPSYQGNGLWPALWMLGEDITSIGWPDCGEIDLMEYVSYNPNMVVQTIHSVANNHTNGTQISTDFVSLPTIEEDFHNYGIIWEEDKLQFYIDTPDNITLTFDRPESFNNDNWPFSKKYFFLLNIAVGGNWGGLQGVDDAIFPAIMEVDYVRVYEL